MKKKKKKSRYKKCRHINIPKLDHLRKKRVAKKNGKKNKNDKKNIKKKYFPKYFYIYL